MQVLRRGCIVLLVLWLSLTAFESCERRKQILSVPAEAWQVDLEAETLRLVNQHRLSVGLPELVVFDPAAEEARKHSQDLAAGAVSLGHVGFEDRIRRLKAKVPIVAAGENEGVVKGHEDPAKAVVESWLRSEGHRQNIEGDFDLTGIGVARDEGGTYYFTQIFLKSKGE